MHVCFAINGFCKTGFMNRLSGKYRRPEVNADTLVPHFRCYCYCRYCVVIVVLLLMALAKSVLEVHTETV